jgi:hypothetical protein
MIQERFNSLEKFVEMSGVLRTRRSVTLKLIGAYGELLQDLL